MSQDFKNGKIYKITNNINNEVYVGSTCDILRKRFNYHTCHSRQENKLNRPLYKMMNELGIDTFRIDLIEDYPCDDKQALRQREGYWIRQIGTLNEKIAGRTKKEYDNDNKEKIKDYREKTKETTKEYMHQWYLDNKDKYKTSEKKKEYMKIYYLKNKDKF